MKTWCSSGTSGPGTTTKLSTGASPRMSANGRFVTFYTFADLVPHDTNNGNGDTYVRDRWTGTTRLVSVALNGRSGNNVSADAGITANGRFVVFDSWATNLVHGDTNNASDLFVRDRWTGTTRRVSVGAHGVQINGNGVGGGPISADGRFVAFVSDWPHVVPGDTNGLADVFVHRR